MLVVESIENTSYIFIQTWSQTLEYEFIIQKLEFFICFSSFINRNEITLYFYPVYIFLALFLSINRMNINSYKFGWLAVIMTMMYRVSNPNILQRLYKWPIYKTCSHIHYLLILSFTLILVAVTTNKIVTKEACSALFDCCFFFQTIFFKVWFDPLKLYSLIQCYFLYSKRSCLGQFNFYPQGSPESFANPNLCEPCN